MKQPHTVGLYYQPTHTIKIIMPSFPHRHIQDLASKLALPPVLQIKQKKGHIERSKALGIVLSWLAFPKRQLVELPVMWNIERRKICA